MSHSFIITFLEGPFQHPLHLKSTKEKVVLINNPCPLLSLGCGWKDWQLPVLYFCFYWLKVGHVRQELV